MTSLNKLFAMVIFLAGSVVLPAEAHNRSQSFSSWSIHEQQLSLVFTVKEREATRFQQTYNIGIEASLLSHLKQTIQVTQASLNCPVSNEFRAMTAKPGYLRIAATFNCPEVIENSAPSIEIGSFFSLVSSHIHYARIAMPGQVPLEYLFTESHQAHSIVLGTANWSTSLQQAFLQYTVLGIEHIFTGIDHIAFLLALLLLLRGIRDVIWLVSGFTLGHSITLSLAVLGWVTPEPVIVEALIGFTIALVAAENISSRTGANRQIAYVATGVLILMLLLSLSSALNSRLPAITFAGLILFTISYLPSTNSVGTIETRPILSLAFGLIHGFGFASVLQEVGLPPEQLWPALLGFNIGVELGQLLIVIALWAGYLWLRKYKSLTTIVPDISSALLCGLGLYWFIARSYGPAF
ncbi:MAG: HupE/UreJ family protein [Porticoccaceae bacterium]|nr:HupE/UreJ family protein [Porticoccaceae bacterium]